MQDVLGEPVDPSWLEPLWTDSAIRELTSRLANTDWLAMVDLRRAMFAKRDEYEKDRANFQAVYEYYIDAAEKGEDDRARLVAQVEDLQTGYDQRGGTIDAMVEDIEEMQATIDALRAASRIADATLTGDLEIARDRIRELEQQLATLRAATPVGGGEGVSDENVLHWVDVVTTAVLDRQDEWRSEVGIAASALVDWMLEQRQEQEQSHG